MQLRSLAILNVFACLVSAVPSASAICPIKAVVDLNDDDLTGSGYETRGSRYVEAAERDSAFDALRGKIARRRLDMAARARRQAKLLEEPERRALLAKAEQYEMRARRMNGSSSS